MELDKIIEEAYKLYMPQINSEITQLSEFVENHIGHTLKSDPYNILEIGTKFGGTFYIWNKLNPYGMNISIDFDDGGKHGGIGSDQMDKRDLWFQERFSNCHFIRGDSHANDTLVQLFSLLVNSRMVEIDPMIQFEGHKMLIDPIIDFLFIDGDHTHEGVKQDFLTYKQFCKPGSIICFHDITISDHHHSRDVYVGEFWNEIKDDYEHYEFVEPGNNWGGVGVLIYN